MAIKNQKLLKKTLIYLIIILIIIVIVYILRKIFIKNMQEIGSLRMISGGLTEGCGSLRNTLENFQQAPIKIGVSGPFTGRFSLMGISMRNGVKLAADEINKASGILKRSIELVEQDDEDNLKNVVNVSNKLIDVPVIATIGFINSFLALVATKFYQNAKIPVIIAGATLNKITQQFLPPNYEDNYIFRVAATDSIQAQMIVEEAVTKRGFKKIAILTSYGYGSELMLEKALATKGIKPVSKENFKFGVVDMTAQLLKAKEAGAEVILTYAIDPSELAGIANSMTKLDWKVPIIGSDNSWIPSFIDNAGPGGKGATMPQTFIQDYNNNTPKQKAFIDAYLKMYKPQNSRIDFPDYAAQGYDSMYLLAAAIKQAKSTDGPQILAALQNLKDPVNGVIKDYIQPFSKTNHEAINLKDLVMSDVKNGKIVYAYQKDIQKK